MDYKCEHSMIEQNQRLHTPEHYLWVAVVDRAIYDYSTFADWVCQRQTYEKKSKRHKLSRTIEARMIREYEALRWFLFEDAEEEFNLSWIMDHVFNAGHKMRREIRERCQLAHETNIAVYAQLPQLKQFIEVYEAKTGIKVEPKSVDEIDITVYPKMRMRRQY